MVDHISTMNIIIFHLPRSQHYSEEEHRNVYGEVQETVERCSICSSGSQVTSIFKGKIVPSSSADDVPEPQGCPRSGSGMHGR